MLFTSSELERHLESSFQMTSGDDYDFEIDLENGQPISSIALAQ
jgi:hypothetical protein